MTLVDVDALVREDMRALHDTRVVAHVSSLLVTPPRQVLLMWPYGAFGEEVFEGFLVLDHPRSGTGIAYCRQGFGPEFPWGIIATDREPLWTGMSDGWYTRFLNAYFESMVSIDLDIWRVKEQKPEQTANWVSEELPWDEAWKRVYALRESATDRRYDCDHAVTY